MKERDIRPYSLHPGFAMEEGALERLSERTGCDLDQWIRRLEGAAPPNRAARVRWLQSQGLTTNVAGWVAARAEGEGGSENYDPAALVEAQYAGKRSALRAIYDRLLALALDLGPDVKACPGRTIVPLYRKHVFAQIKPTTNSRIDLGLALGERAAEGRLVETGGFEKKDRITHRIPVSSIEEIDEPLVRWLAAAYERDA